MRGGRGAVLRDMASLEGFSGQVLCAAPEGLVAAVRVSGGVWAAISGPPRAKSAFVGTWKVMRTLPLVAAVTGRTAARGAGRTVTLTRAWGARRTELQRSMAGRRASQPTTAHKTALRAAREKISKSEGTPPTPNRGKPRPLIPPRAPPAHAPAGPRCRATSTPSSTRCAPTTSSSVVRTRLELIDEFRLTPHSLGPCKDEYGLILTKEVRLAPSH